jgi:hypothetical protein
VTSTEIVIKRTGEVADVDSINAYLSRIVESLPDQDEGDVYGILAQIINSETLEDLDSPWQSAGMKAYDGYAVEIRSIKKMPSDIPGGLDWYLLCEGIILETGEYKAFSTGASAVLAQLLVAWERNMFPYRCYIRISKKPTKKGFYPMHLETYRGGPLVDHGEDEQGPGHRIPASRGTRGPGRRPEAPFDPQTAADAQSSDERRHQAAGQ